MSKYLFVIVLVSFLSFNPRVVLSEKNDDSDKIQVSEEMLHDMARDTQKHRVEELARLISNLERRLNRLEDRFEKLDNDLKELKRKV